MRRTERRLDASILVACALLVAMVVFEAERALRASRTVGQAEVAARDPLDPDALAAEGFARLRRGDLRGGAAILDFAGARSWRDWPVQGWLMQRSIEAGRLDEAVNHADALLRTDGDGALSAAIFRFLDAVAAEPGSRAALVVRLSRRHRTPWWRERYLQHLAVAASLPGTPGPAGGALDARSAIQLLAALAATARPPLVGEYRPLVEALAAHGREAEALGLWRGLAHRPDRGVALRDGTFADDGDDTDFTWRRASGVGVSSEFAPLDAGRALHLSYDGVADASLPAQLMVLPPGRYRLAWRTRLAGPFRLAWRVRCSDGGPVIADEAAAAAPTAAWSDRSLTFDVAAQGCAAQWVELIARPGERPTGRGRVVRELRPDRASRTIPAGHRSTYRYRSSAGVCELSATARAAKATAPAAPPRPGKRRLIAKRRYSDARLRNPARRPAKSAPSLTRTRSWGRFANTQSLPIIRSQSP